MANIIYMFKFFLIIICLFIIFTFFNKINQTQSNNKVPKIIWSYWDTEEVPEIVKLSIKSWKKTSPNYKINFTNQKTIIMIFLYIYFIS
jgi:mannosyltransferase OCH1-like enzyme